MLNTIIKIIKKLSKREKKIALIPTPFDNLPDPFNEVEKFIEKEFYLLMYQLINNPPSVIHNEIYKKSFLSFVLTFSISTVDDLQYLEAEKKDVFKLKEYFYQQLTINCIEKMSFYLKVIFYRYYNINAFPKITIVKTERFKEVLEKFEFLLKRNPKLYEKIEKGLNKFIIDVQLESDKELVDYILNWARMKFDFIGAEITLLRNQFINADPRLIKLKTIPMDYWGDESAGRNQIDRKDIIQEIRILNGSIESQYFLTHLKSLFNK